MTVYFVKCNEFVKIGYSSNPMQRIVQLQIGSPYPQELLALMPGDLTTESELQGVFYDYRHSNEWFRFEGDLVVFIEEMGKVFSDYAKKIKKNGSYVNERDWRYWKRKAISAQDELKETKIVAKAPVKKKEVLTITNALSCPDCGKMVKGIKGLNGHKAWCEGQKVKSNGHLETA